MNRRSFLKTLFAASALPFISLPKKEERYIQHFQKPINWKIPDHFDLLGQQRGIARELLMVDYLAKGTIARYENNPDCTVWLGYHHADWAQELNDSNCRIIPVKSNDIEVLVPTGHHTVEANNVKEAEYKLHDKEDRLFFKIKEDAGLFIKIKTTPEKPNIIAALNKAFKEIEKQGITVANIVMHPNTYKKYIRPMGKIVYNELDVNEIDTLILHYEHHITPKYYKKTGYVGNLWGTDIKLSNLLPQNKIILSAPAEYIGAMPIRIEQYYHQPANLYIAEEGQAIINEKSIITLELI